ncbi:YihY family inner membrane protein [Castellaniella sp.]|uniref:YihY family inner membrane protein n=1 Tax=Castellaniella sp. TaxID=1955812 RepID=UPI00356A3860
MRKTFSLPGPVLSAERRTHILDILKFTLEFAARRKLTQVASSLTFTTVLAIVPLLAVVLALFTAFPLFGEFRHSLEAFLADSLLPPSVSDTIVTYLNQFAAQASGLTAVGGAFLVVTSILLIMTIDEAFNDIWRVARQRPLRQRLLVYWASISLGPLLVGASLWASAVVMRESLGYIAALPDTFMLLLTLVPFLVSVLGFTALYVFVPNCRVQWRDALAGGLGATVVLSIMKGAFTWYLTQFPSYTVIYGAFATLPIFLLWIYLSWLVILMGATVASLLPALRLRSRSLQHQRGAGILRALDILQALWLARDGNPPGLDLASLEAQLQLHPDDLDKVLNALRESGYAVPVADSDHWVLACNPASTDITPAVERLLLDTRQPGIQEWQLQALSDALRGEAPLLDPLFTSASVEKRTDQAQ